MKNVVLIIALFFMTIYFPSCGKDYNYYEINQETESRSGFYYLDGPSESNCIYLEEKFPGVFNLTSECQNLLTINPENDTIGQFPRITASNLLLNDNSDLIFSGTMNLTSGNDIEEDESGDNLTGRKRFDAKISFNQDNKLTLKISVYAENNFDNLNFIVVEREFKQVSND